MMSVTTMATVTVAVMVMLTKMVRLLVWTHSVALNLKVERETGRRKGGSH